MVSLGGPASLCCSVPENATGLEGNFIEQNVCVSFLRILLVLARQTHHENDVFCSHRVYVDRVWQLVLFVPFNYDAATYVLYWCFAGSSPLSFGQGEKR